MRVWVLGAKGLLGTAVERCLKQQRIPVIATARAQSDITDIKSLLHFAQTVHPTHIINCAAYTDVDKAEKEVMLTYAVNSLGPENLGTVAKHCNAKLVHVSTDYVFQGSPGQRPFLETDSCEPQGVYARSKRQGEKRLLAELPTACIVRTSWVFGIGGRNFLSNILQQMHQKEELRVVTDQISRPTYVYDLAEALIHLLCHSGIFHFANEGSASRFEIANIIFQLAQQKGMRIKCREIHPAKVSDFPQGAPRPLCSILDTQKIAQFLGFRPRHWEEALPNFFEQVSL